MLLWMEQEIDKLGVSKGTASHYRCTLTALTEFGLMRKWSDLSVEHIHRFDAYLHAIKKHQTDAEIKAKKPVEYISQATVRNYHKDFKALLARALKFGLINAWLNAQMKGVDYDLNERIYNALPNVTLQDIVKFEQEQMANKPYRFVILGNEKELDMKALQELGPIKRLSTEEIFGY